MLPLDNLKLRDIEAGFMSRRHMFSIYNPGKKYFILTSTTFVSKYKFIFLLIGVIAIYLNQLQILLHNSSIPRCDRSS